MRFFTWTGIAFWVVAAVPLFFGALVVGQHFYRYGMTLSEVLLSITAFVVVGFVCWLMKD